MLVARPPDMVAADAAGLWLWRTSP